MELKIWQGLTAFHGNLCKNCTSSIGIDNERLEEKLVKVRSEIEVYLKQLMK
jgi:hypothetical protein